MGYYINQRETQFSIKKENIPACLERMKSLCNREDKMGGGRGIGGEEAEKWFAWVDMDELKNATTINQAFNAWRWTVELDKNGNIEHLCFLGEKLGDDEFLFGSIAEFIESGSFIEISGEDGDLWRWVFEDGAMRNSIPVWE